MSVVRIIGVVLGMLLLVVCGGVALITFVANPSMSDSGQIGGTILLVAVAVGGLFLVKRSSPGFFGRLVGGVGGSPGGFLHWLRRPETRTSPLGMAVWTLLIGLVLLMLPTGGARLLIALGLYLVYTLFALIALVSLPRWWCRALLTLLLGPVVMSGLIFTAEAFKKNVIGEAALAFLGPLMWSWAAIPVTGLIRLVIARPAPPPDQSGQPT